jgi:hypothetical protein
VPGLLNSDAAAAYDPAKIAAANQTIRDNWSQTNENPLYNLVESGTLDPIVGPDYITTRAFYPSDDDQLIALGLAGQPHGQSRGGVGVDMGTGGFGLPVVLVEPETILMQDSSFFFDVESGNTVQTRTDWFARRSGHLEDTYALNALQGLIQSGMDTSLFRFDLPAGYQIGNVGGTGNFSTGVHYHWEWNPLWNY